MRRRTKNGKHQRKKTNCRTRKIGYRDEYEALAAMSAIVQRKTDEQKKPTRAYKCQFCDMFHLTSALERENDV